MRAAAANASLGWGRAGATVLTLAALLLGAGGDAWADDTAAHRDTPRPAGLPSPLDEADFFPVDPEVAALGRLLFWDPILSGNRNISCATCHNPRFGTSDGVPLALGEGGKGLGPARRVDPVNPPEERVARNAPALFNMGARGITRLFHDGRIERDPARGSGLRTPLEDDMMLGFDSLLSAQTMFPVLSQDEMAGHYSENEVSRAARQGRITGPGGAWDLLAARVSALPEYARRFARAYPEIAAGREIAFTDISNAIAVFVAAEWRADDSPFDRYLRGEADLPPAALRGMDLFYGKAGCASCHSGALLSDQEFWATGVPQFGPGKAARFETHSRDMGRMRVTGRAEDAYAFRTPFLRNVSLTAPYGHTGAFATLAGFLDFHLDPAKGLAEFDPAGVTLPDLEGAQDWAFMSDPAEVAALRDAIVLRPVSLAPDERAALLAFLEALTDESALPGRLGPPESVPSGLPLDR